MTTTCTYRADVVGSMLRPRELVEARAALRAGAVTEETYRAVEDRAVDAALSIQEAAGVDVATDGEMRRDLFFDFFVSGAEGITPGDGWLARFRNAQGEGAMAVKMPFVVTDKLRATGSPGLAEYLYARERTELPIKVTLPSPTAVTPFWTKEASSDVYPDVFELVADATAIVRDWVAELAEAGCPYIQIDAPELNALYADERIREEYAERGISPERYMAEGAEQLNEVTKVDRPPGATLGVHVCKGNGTQSWIAEGGYEDIARDVFKRASGFDRFLLEFDDERSGSFEPLRHLPDDKVAVLGLISTKWTTLEDPGLLQRRIDEASRFHPRDRLAISTQCGFASAAETAEQRKVTEQTQVDKLRLVARTARAVWGESVGSEEQAATPRRTT
jgi:5-methyltetrahydropteroyltriglutamate--homocysteine methyltransferase